MLSAEFIDRSGPTIYETLAVDCCNLMAQIRQSPPCDILFFPQAEIMMQDHLAKRRNPVRRAPLPPFAEFLRLAAAQTNLLVEGTELRVEAVLAALTPHLVSPLTTWGGGVALPTGRRGTLMVPHVERLHEEHQQQLLRWLSETNGTVRVVATTSGSLFRLVLSGAFLDALYYRLNIVRVEVAAERAAQPAVRS